MNSPLRTTLLAATAVLATLLTYASAARAEPPVPEPPAYQVPQWPTARPGQWPAPPENGADPDTAASRPTRDPSGPVADVVAELNRRRSEAGCSRVRLRASLSRAARAHSADMARHEHLAHTGSDGSSPQERMRAVGYRPGHSGEVVAVGTDTAEAAVAVWMDSPPHRDIILTCRFTDAGIGVVDSRRGPWWTVDLAARR
ncbi:CAP domain-containing protein [Streptomyces sp. NPDC087844]|uniref:CAP domain-containing protein n=1 Tax=Streptomyces sp. NPDC087844 TaxID=3365805 RepID=UPI003815FA72